MTGMEPTACSLPERGGLRKSVPPFGSISHATGQKITKPRDCRDLDEVGSVNFAVFLLRAARNLIYSGMK